METISNDNLNTYLEEHEETLFIQDIKDLFDKYDLSEDQKYKVFAHYLFELRSGVFSSFKYDKNDIETLYSLGFDPSKKAIYYISGDTNANAFHFACAYPYTGLIEEFLSKGVDPNNSDNSLKLSPLEFVCSFDYSDESVLVENIELLLKYGAKKEISGWVLDIEYESDYMKNFVNSLSFVCKDCKY